MEKTALILGSNGGFGGAVAQELQARGWTVRPFRRGSDMQDAAQGVDLIVNGLNPPNYHNWAEIIPAITRQVIAAARQSGARVLVPGNVYVFGDQPGPWSSQTPHRPNSRKGAIRAKMEADYRDFVRDHGGRVLILRGGDFLGVQRSLAFHKVLLKDIASGKFTLMGNSAAKRAWAWLPDMARAAVDLIEMPDLSDFADLSFPGYTASQSDLALICEAQMGRPLRRSPFPEWILPLAAPFWELARELREMMYLWHDDHGLSDAEFRAVLPGFTPTPLPEAMRQMLAVHGL